MEPNVFFGKQIRIDIHAVQQVPVVHARSWKERWFTLPWRPFTTIRTETREIPACYETRECFIMHPAYYEGLKKELEKMFGLPK